jgi:predicted ABC-type exoprotein transport system permease subunit
MSIAKVTMPRVAEAEAHAGAPRSRSTGGFYLVVVASMILVVLLGFWPFYAALPGGGSGDHWFTYLHAAVFSAWMILLAAQVVLVDRRRVRTHRRLGKVGVGLGALVLVVGLVISFVSPARSVLTGTSTLDEAAGFLILPLGDMLLFGGFFIAAVLLRDRRELHKRLMILATVALLFAPAARFAGSSGELAILAVWLLPLGLAIAYDGLVRRRIERVWYVGVAVLLVAFARVRLMEAEPWLALGRRVLLALMPEGGAG